VPHESYTVGGGLLWQPATAALNLDVGDIRAKQRKLATISASSASSIPDLPPENMPSEGITFVPDA
jgi:hypothetical protein